MPRNGQSRSVRLSKKTLDCGWFPLFTFRYEDLFLVKCKHRKQAAQNRIVRNGSTLSHWSEEVRHHWHLVLKLVTFRPAKLDMPWIHLHLDDITIFHGNWQEPLRALYGSLYTWVRLEHTTSECVDIQWLLCTYVGGVKESRAFPDLSRDISCRTKRESDCNRVIPIYLQLIIMAGVSVEQTQGTVRPAQPFDAEEDSKRLRKAMKGFGKCCQPHRRVCIRFDFVCVCLHVIFVFTFIAVRQF